jgi:hypothetical protein
MKLIKGVQNEANSRPDIGGEGEGPRQVELNVGLVSSEVKEARKKFDAGRMTVEELENIAGIGKR